MKSQDHHHQKHPKHPDGKQNQGSDHNKAPGIPGGGQQQHHHHHHHPDKGGDKR